MEFTRCFHCMEETSQYPCPHCGYDPGAGSAFPYALRPGTILNGKYVVGTVLGQGGFGITYIGWDLALESKVAIKEYFPSAQVSRTARDSGREMFLKEARKMSRVSDIPQVVRVRDLFQQNNTAYIVMEFIEGKTLKDHLKKTGPLAWDQTKEIFLPAIDAMEQVHGAGLGVPSGQLKTMCVSAQRSKPIRTFLFWEVEFFSASLILYKKLDIHRTDSPRPSGPPPSQVRGQGVYPPARLNCPRNSAPAESQASATLIERKTSAGVLQLRHSLGRLLIRSSTN